MLVLGYRMGITVILARGWPGPCLDGCQAGGRDVKLAPGGFLWHTEFIHQELDMSDMLPNHDTMTSLVQTAIFELEDNIDRAEASLVAIQDRINQAYRIQQKFMERDQAELWTDEMQGSLDAAVSAMVDMYIKLAQWECDRSMFQSQLDKNIQQQRDWKNSDESDEIS